MTPLAIQSHSELKVNVRCLVESVEGDVKRLSMRIRFQEESIKIGKVMQADYRWTESEAERVLESEQKSTPEDIPN